VIVHAFYTPLAHKIKMVKNKHAIIVWPAGVKVTRERSLTPQKVSDVVSVQSRKKRYLHGEPREEADLYKRKQAEC